jgi:hypothetical protein
MPGALISQEQLRDIAARTHAREVTILRRVVGLPVRGAAAYAVDVELARSGVLRAPRSDDGETSDQRAPVAPRSVP